MVAALNLDGPGHAPPYLCVSHTFGIHMPVIHTASDKFMVGERMNIEGPSPEGTFSAVFEDDGDTGYFYALNRGGSDENPILNAMHIYNVNNISDKNLESEVIIAWSEDFLKVVLLINGFPHGVFDFSQKRGWCRTGFPTPNPNSGWMGHEWDDKALKLFA